MFGLFKSQMAPEGPIEFENVIEIEASAEDVYRLIDFADRANAHRARGDTVMDLGGGMRFELCLADLPDVNFCFAVSEAEPAKRYAYEASMQPRVGKLEYSQESYEIEPLGEHSCKVTQTTVAKFVDGLKLKTFASEATMMAAAAGEAQHKLKLQAEQGVEAVREYEESRWG